MSAAMKITTPTDREIVITRSFAAPLDHVWAAMTRADLLKKWLFCPPGWRITSWEDDLRVGGSFHWQWSTDEGPIMSMRGQYREIAPPRPGSRTARIVRTETFDMGCQPQAGEQVCTLALEQVSSGAGAATTMTLTVVYPSKHSRDAALASGMEQGMSAGYDQLDAILASSPIKA